MLLFRLFNRVMLWKQGVPNTDRSMHPFCGTESMSGATFTSKLLLWVLPFYLRAIPKRRPSSTKSLKKFALRLKHICRIFQMSSPSGLRSTVFAPIPLFSLVPNGVLVNSLGVHSPSLAPKLFAPVRHPKGLPLLPKAPNYITAFDVLVNLLSV